LMLTASAVSVAAALSHFLLAPVECKYQEGSSPAHLCVIVIVIVIAIVIAMARVI
jgi:hypothetical protein